MILRFGEEEIDLVILYIKSLDIAHPIESDSSPGPPHTIGELHRLWDDAVPVFWWKLPLTKLFVLLLVLTGRITQTIIPQVVGASNMALRNTCTSSSF